MDKFDYAMFFFGFLLGVSGMIVLLSIMEWTGVI